MVFSSFGYPFFDAAFVSRLLLLFRFQSVSSVLISGKGSTSGLFSALAVLSSPNKKATRLGGSISKFDFSNSISGNQVSFKK
jgi:hypothetical protein